MKVTRSTKSAINRRANAVACALAPVFVARMTAMIEAGQIEDADLADWWPEEYSPPPQPGGWAGLDELDHLAGF